jgi:hypothetical protein
MARFVILVALASAAMVRADADDRFLQTTGQLASSLSGAGKKSRGGSGVSRG